MSGWKFILALIVIGWGFDNFLNRVDGRTAFRIGAGHPQLKLSQGIAFIVSFAAVVILLGMVPASVWHVLM